jgi:hypothetical protein
MNPRYYIKAVAATVMATAAASLGNAMADGNITVNEAVAALGLGLVAGAAVYLSPKNATAPAGE